MHASIHTSKSQSLPNLGIRIGLITFLVVIFQLANATNVTYAQSVVPQPNPDLAPACGINVALVLDASRSVDDDVPDEAPSDPSPQEQVRASAQSFVNALEDTGSNVAIIEFASMADTPVPYSLVNQETITNTFGPYLNGTGSGDSYHDGRLGECTNWESGFQQINALPTKAELVVFMTDGQPNTINGGTACGATVPDALDAAASQANITKSGDDGSHIFVIGIGDAVAESNLRTITEDPNQRYNTVNLSTADYTLGSFGSFYSDLQEIAFGLCSPSVTINKVVDELDGNGDVPQPGQSFTGDLSIDSGTYNWVTPTTATGNGQQGVTNDDGNLTFQWERSDLTASSVITITETVQNGYSYVGSNCEVKTLNNPTPQTLPIQSAGQASFTAQVNTGDLVTCTVHNERHRITVDKSATPVTLPEPGGPITYTFVVTNTGASDVTLTTLNDSDLGNLNGQGSCLTHSVATPVTISGGQSYTCSVVQPLSGNAGQVHSHAFTAGATNGNGAETTATDSATVTLTDIQPAAIIKTSASPASQPEASAPFTYTVVVTNTSAAEAIDLISLEDQSFGNTTQVGGNILSTGCTVPQPLAAAGQTGSSYECQFVATLQGNPGDYANTVSAMLQDDDGNQITVSDSASVSLNDVPPTALVTIAPNPDSRNEPGGQFAFTLTVSNTNSAESLVVDSLSNSLYGDVTTVGGQIISTTCPITETLSPAGQSGDSYSCLFSVEHPGAPGIFESTTTAQLSDDDSNQVSVGADAQVAIIDVPSTIQVTRDSDRVVVPEPGGNVAFTVTIRNSSLVDSITVTDILDSPADGGAPVDISSTCAAIQPISLPVTLAPSETIRCTYTQFVSGNAGDIYANGIVVHAVDDDGIALEASADESIDIIDLPSAIRVTKLAPLSEVMDPGADVDYMVTVENSSQGDNVTVTTLIDDRFGDISAGCDLALPADLAPGAILSCPFTGFVGGTVGTTHINIVTATAMDDDGNMLQDSDQEEINIDDIPSSIKVIESASPSGVSEPGADVTFTTIVRNTSQADSVMITQVVRVVNGANGEVETDISGSCFLAPPTLLAPGEEIVCEFTDFVGGTSGDSLTNQVWAYGQDDDGNPVSDFDIENVDVFDVSSSIRATKEAEQNSIPEPGGPISFTITVKNTSLVDDVTVNQIVTNQPGSLLRMGSANDLGQNSGEVTASGAGNQCSLPQTLAPGASLTCLSVEQISGAVGSTVISTVAVEAIDDDGNILTDGAQASVDITDVPSAIQVTLTASQVGLSEPGGSVLYTAQIQNTSQLDSITIQSVTSDEAAAVGSSCSPALTTTLAPGDEINCTYTLTFFGNQGDTFSDAIVVTAVDDDGMTISDSDSEQVDIVNLLPTISVRKTVSPTRIPETGADVTFTFEIVNNSATEQVNLENMQDASLGDLNGLGDCAVPQTLDADGGRYSCTVTLFIEGDFGNNESAEVRATAFDDDGSSDTSFDIQEIFFTDVLPNIDLTIAVSPTTILETGQDVRQALIITNNSAEAVEITELIDTAGVSLHGQGSCILPQTIEGNGTYTCAFPRFISGQFGNPDTGVYVATGMDDEENIARAADSVQVRFIKVAPELTVTKTDGLLIDTFDEESQQGLVSPGDTLAYTITVTNLGNQVATDVILRDPPPEATRLVAGSVQTSQGTVTIGNSDGDTTVEVNLGLLGINASATVVFNVLVDPDTDVQIINNQASVEFGGEEVDGTNVVLSSDPAAPGGGATTTPITFAPSSLPLTAEPSDGTLTDNIFLPMILK